MSATPQPQLPFTRLGDYEVLAPISEGGMASVWLGRSAERMVALKVIRPEHGRNKEFVAMFLDEARIASRLSHPNIVAIHGLGHDGKRHFLAMEVLRGRTLLDLWRAAGARQTRLPVDVVAWIGARVADALHHAHELKDERGAAQHVVHRDVNPANIFVTVDGVPKLIDFGLARARDRIASTAVGVVKGKLAYLSPEQTRGQTADRRADVFALGVTLWELTTNRRLFREDSDVETVRRVREASVPDPRTVVDGYPDALAEALLRALARDPAERWQTAAELRDALDAFVRTSGRPVSEAIVRALLDDLSAGQSAAAWERLVEDGDVGGERVRVWDDERQKMTWMQASIESAAPERVEPEDLPTMIARPEARTRRERLDRALEERLTLPPEGLDAAPRARLHLERAMVDELLGDGERVALHAGASLAATPTAAAHETLRRALHGQPASARALVAHVDAEIALVASERARAGLLAERARLIASAGEPAAIVRAAWEKALAAAPKQPAALAGLDAALAADDAAGEAHARHLAVMAEAYAQEPRLAAWLHVERARLLDRDASGRAAATAALDQAIALDPGIGPVRAACVEHAAAHRDSARLVALLEHEARLEAPARAARLELDAACIARGALRDDAAALSLLERAAARAEADPAVRRRALDDLVRTYEHAGRVADALRARAARLPLVAEPGEAALELRSIAAAREGLGDVPGAVAALEDALARAPGEEATAEALDRLLEASGAAARRAELWSRLAAATTDDAERAARLVRAANLAEAAGDVAGATESLRAALVASPADAAAVDGLLRLLAERSEADTHAQARARIAVHAHAAAHAVDPARRVAHLEAVALLQEERLGDDAAALETHEAILRIDPGRRGALLGLARVATRAGQSGKAAGALLTEAAAATDAAESEALRVRAAGMLAASDAERALGIAQDVLARRPAHTGALRLVQRLHEAAGRWGQVDATIAARIAHATDARARAALWLSAAEVRAARLRDPAGALEAARAALAADPTDPAARAAVVARLEASGDVRALRDGLLALASGETDTVARARWTVRAAEIDELSLEDDAHALSLYDRALSDAPGDPWLIERRARLLARARGNGDAPPADPRSPGALRALEREARRSGSLERVAGALAQQVAALNATAPKLGALWSLAAIRRSVPDGEEPAVLDAILSLAPDDPAALSAAIRASLPAARSGDARARERVLAALRTRLEQAVDDPERLWNGLALALLLEPETPSRTDEALEALARYRDALRVDGGSVLAAHGTARLGGALGDAEATVEGTLALARLASVSSQRAVLLVQAAARLAGTDDARLGVAGERRARAAEVLESALDADPDAIPAIGLLVAMREEQGARDRLLATLRSAFDRARSTEAATHLGTEVARLAALVDPPDRVLAIDALRRVLALRPGHAPTLRALAEQHAAQGAWGDEVEALESIAASAADPATRLRALFQLADVHAQRLKRPADEERALLAALDVDPANLAALRRLVDGRRARGAGGDAIAPLLERLVEATDDAAGKAACLDELAELRAAAGDPAGAERARVEAHAQAPTPQRLARLTELVAPAAGAPEQARLLSLAVERARALERPDPATLSRLGRLEVGPLARHAEGVEHLRLALALAPGSHEARAALAAGLLHTGSPGESAALLAPMIAPDAAPLLSLDDPAAALATLDAALTAESRPDEALVARELRAIAGGLDDGAHAELRARRLVIDPNAPVPIALDAATLRAAVVPHDAPPLLLDVAGALAGVETKLAEPEPDAAGRDRRAQPPDSLRLVVHRLATLLGLAWPEVVLIERGARPRMGGRDGASLLVPEPLLERPEPVVAAMIAAPLVRVALGVPWLEDLRGAAARSVLLAAVRVVVPGHGEGPDDEVARRVTRAIGRKQKKALAELAPALAAAPAPDAQQIARLERAVARTELRAAFVATGDLLATLDAARAADEALERETSTVGPAALRMALTHPLAGDLARFALAPATVTLRWRAGSLWSRQGKA